ncbi:hypothetical protein BT93_L0116 [Corymbia citriodora subsp. variegata]|uniref:Uncharacterized protein n=1 Tax=Corymbia citriodora subsp. variegata TaxID=360336 RepID=A0A8T0CEX4_CORYI|nr:hypothetical protein BT93_L0116 [Corymbia citriodora subsp. variegata]
MDAMEKQPLIESEPTTLESLRNRLAEARATLTTAQRDVCTANQEYIRAWSQTRRGRITRWLIFSLIMFTFALPLTGILYLGLTDDDDYEEYLPRRVPLEAHIMSKCPDARDCLHDLVLPAMVNVSHYVDFKLSYIGKYEEDEGVICKHGESECLGNILELCAAKTYPDPKIYLGFTMCLSRNFSDIPNQELAQDCALEHGISFEKLNQCVSADDGQRGVDMLRDSVLRSAEKNVTKSCTVRIDDKEWCIRDGGEWVDCAGGHEPKDLVEEILERRLQHTSGRE